MTERQGLPWYNSTVMKTLIVIPAYNEEENIVRVVDNLIQNYPEYDYIVVNDGSSDQTKQICKEHGYYYLNQKVNLGLAGTFQTGMKYALRHNYDAVIQFDGDGQHRPEYISDMVREIEKGTDIVIGSRFVEEKKPKTMRMFGSNMIELFLFLTTGRKINDPTSGMRMYSKRIIKTMAEEANLAPEPDTIAYLIKCGAKTSEVQVKMDERIAGTSYLTAAKSAHYMAYVSISIIFISWFRKKIKLEKGGDE